MMNERASSVNRAVVSSFFCLPAILCEGVALGEVPYEIVDTGQVRCYSDDREIQYPKLAAGWFGQDAQYAGNQ
ncbi:MAG: hypothetical protein GY794_04440, partial [bacterium]|nr:hypothetical protein [bacterium]